MKQNTVSKFSSCDSITTCLDKLEYPTQIDCTCDEGEGFPHNGHPNNDAKDTTLLFSSTAKPALGYIGVDNSGTAIKIENPLSAESRESACITVLESHLQPNTLTMCSSKSSSIGEVSDPLEIGTMRCHDLGEQAATELQSNIVVLDNSDVKTKEQGGDICDYITSPPVSGANHCDNPNVFSYFDENELHCHTAIDYSDMEYASHDIIPAG